MKMLNCCTFAVTLLCCTSIFAQQNSIKNEHISEHTLMGKFEKAYVLTAEERISMKMERITLQQEIKKQLDSIDMTDKKRARLLRELRRNPFSEKVQKSIYANTHFEDEELEVIKE